MIAIVQSSRRMFRPMQLSGIATFVAAQAALLTNFSANAECLFFTGNSRTHTSDETQDSLDFFFGADTAVILRGDPARSHAEVDATHEGDSRGLRNAILRVFPNAEFSSDHQVDPEEDWSKEVVTVRTGISDLDERIQMEDIFFDEVASNEDLSQALERTILKFA